MIHSCLKWSALVTLSLFCLGCGSGLNLKPATGTVTYNGKPVEGASVAFISDKNPVAIGTTDASGKYSLTTNGEPGAPVAKHMVTVSKSTSTTGMAAGASPDDMMKMMQKKGASGGGILSKPELPLKYATPQGTDLSAEVTADASKNVFDFTLKD